MSCACDGPGLGCACKQGLWSAPQPRRQPDLSLVRGLGALPTSNAALWAQLGVTQADVRRWSAEQQQALGEATAAYASAYAGVSAVKAKSTLAGALAEQALEFVLSAMSGCVEAASSDASSASSGLGADDDKRSALYARVSKAIDEANDLVAELTASVGSVLALPFKALLAAVVELVNAVFAAAAPGLGLLALVAAGAAVLFFGLVLAA